ncbi:unnamed protein product [Pieris brassicae]|uniref:Uncharacterized protein n=1 Tax=Pieris brassicae TaxID=7116 RepID=A0A9P0T3H5_PIEBR|nr:unnamed protein product [Pieris brassicae]
MKHETMIFRVVRGSARQTTLRCAVAGRATDKYTLLLSINNLQLEAEPVSRRNYSNKKLKPVQIKDKMLETLEELNERRSALFIRCVSFPRPNSLYDNTYPQHKITSLKTDFEAFNNVNSYPFSPL